MKRLLLLSFMFSMFMAHAQLDVVNVDPFNTVMIHPYFEVEMRKGTEEKIEIMSSNVPLGRINVEVNGKTLHLYLEDAKIAFKRIITDNYNSYRSGTQVKAIITYRDLDKLSIYGDERFKMANDLDQRKFTLKVYGDSDVRFESIRAEQLKVSMYGDNMLYIAGGDVNKQKISSYGDNEIRAKKLSGSHLIFANFGDNKLYVGRQDYVRVTAFGDATISFIGNPELDQRIAIGQMTYVSR